MRTRALYVSLILTALVSMHAVAAHAAQSLAMEKECAGLLGVANKELDAARAKGLAGSVYVSRAAGLLGEAKVQQQFAKYRNCVNKAKRARVLIKRANIG